MSIPTPMNNPSITLNEDDKMFPCTYESNGHQTLSFPAYSEFAARALIHQMVQEGRTSYGGVLTLVLLKEAYFVTLEDPPEEEVPRLAKAAEIFFDQTE